MHKTWKNSCHIMAALKDTVNEIKTFVFMDMEATGLPIEENNRTKMTEICFTAVQASHLRLGVFPRVQNKLSLCFNPYKLISYEAEKITGLSNTLLENSSKFSEKTVATINNFLELNSQPICFVAHNGNKFDYPILQRELDKANSSLNDNILCIDTLIAFRELAAHIYPIQTECTENENVDTIDNAKKTIPLEFTPGYDQLLFSCLAQQINETTPKKQIMVHDPIEPPQKKPKPVEARKQLNFGYSFKLVDVFTQLTKRAPTKSHQADGDVDMMVMCAATLGDKFVDWANKNYIKFCDIPAMVPGTKIGF